MEILVDSSVILDILTVNPITPISPPCGSLHPPEF